MAETRRAPTRPVHGYETMHSQIHAGKRQHRPVLQPGTLGSESATIGISHFMPFGEHIFTFIGSAVPQIEEYIFVILRAEQGCGTFD